MYQSLLFHKVSWIGGVTQDSLISLFLLQKHLIDLSRNIADRLWNVLGIILPIQHVAAFHII